MDLDPRESPLEGGWRIDCGSMRADEQTQRITWLLANLLQYVAQDASGWQRLYQNPRDYHYWELSYPQSQLAGGGPPTLTWLTKEGAATTYLS